MLEVPKHHAVCTWSAPDRTHRVDCLITSPAPCSGCERLTAATRHLRLLTPVPIGETWEVRTSADSRRPIFSRGRKLRNRCTERWKGRFFALSRHPSMQYGRTSVMQVTSRTATTPEPTRNNSDASESIFFIRKASVMLCRHMRSTDRATATAPQSPLSGTTRRPNDQAPYCRLAQERAAPPFAAPDARSQHPANAHPRGPGTPGACVAASLGAQSCAAARTPYSALRGGKAQSIGACPWRARYSLAAEKWPQPMKPRCADSGEGCGALSTRWRRGSMTLPLAWA